MKILVLNQYFPPDQAATGQLLGQLCADLSRDHDVTVICGTPTYAPDPNSAAPEGVRVIRIPLLRKSRASLLARVLNFGVYLSGAALRVLILPRADVVMCWTDPPLVGLLGVLAKRLKGCRLLFVSQDVYPDVALAAGRMNNPIAVSLLRWAGRRILRSADTIVAVGETMKELLQGKGVPESRIRVIPNWQDTDLLRPPDANDFRDRNKIPEKAFLVMHSGNLGISQDFDALLGAAERTKEHAGILYLIAGDGSRQTELARRIAERALTNVRMLPYQPKERLAQSLAAADLHYVSLLPAFDGCIVPSKIYGILAVARPILANVSEKNEITRIVHESGCGILSTSDPARLAHDIVKASENRGILTEMGLKGRAWVGMQASHRHAFAKYRDVLESLAR